MRSAFSIFIRCGLPALLLTGLAACKEEQAQASVMSDAQRAESLQPADPALRAIYQRSCAACHTSVDAKAPLTGSTAQWKPRLDKGMDLLVKHAMEGFNAMPPKGLCADCSAADMRALIGFMSHQGKDERQ
ncbi:MULTISPECIES: c-type cytochrome [unclassified Variovorax]|jgi:cytochrome c5|uniref:c-type cytochrome n=1 Tax=unclassified Variovorax TaxID=663243 RepID=UPI000F7DA0CD|nr:MULTISPECIES: c-type cytochrome [unclassified Variovorax]RSZ43774.1 cytochrome c5 family protein [Variovorax sp. 553]RSZ45569.1 cytochrome c5 family protein [Variovorax sp. 679]